MVRYVVYIKADIEGVSSISISTTEDICISVRNPLNHDEKREKVVLEAAKLITPDVSVHEKHRTEHPYHLALKWEGETRRSTARILFEDEEIQKSMSEEGRGDCFDGYLPVMALDCDGLEPYAFHPLGKEFIIVDKARNEHKEVDLSSGDWSAYDIGTGSSSVMNLTSKIE
jgi:hypothetical protein